MVSETDGICAAGATQQQQDRTHMYVGSRLGCHEDITNPTLADPPCVYNSVMGSGPDMHVCHVLGGRSQLKC